MIKSPQQITLSQESVVETIALSQGRFSQSSCLIGNREIGSYLIVGQDLMRILPYLNGQMTLKEISLLTRTEIDLIKVFILMLAKASLIKGIDHQTLRRVSETPPKPIISSTIASIFIAASSATALVSLIFLVLASFINPRVVPDSQDFFWSSRQSLNLLSALIFSSFSLVIHEFFHYLFAAIFGLKTSFSISSRLFFLVAEARLRNIFSLLRWQRIAIFASGSAFELIITALLFILKMSGELSPLLLKLLNQFLLIEIISILWQFLFFMKTDFYYIVCEAVGNYHLQEEASDFIFRRKRSNLPKRRELGLGLPLYALFVIIGSALSIYRYLTYHLPVIFGLLKRSFDTLIFNLVDTDRMNSAASILDAGIIFIVEVLYLSTLIIVLLRKLMKRSL